MSTALSALTSQHCKQILKKHLGSGDYQSISFKLIPISDKFQGFIGEHYYLYIDYKREEKNFTHRFFLKTLSSNEVMRELSIDLCMFEKEKFFYAQLLGNLERCGIDTSFAPRGYLFVSNIVVLEDVSQSGYKCVDKMKGLDLEHCKVCLENMAQLHSSSLIYEDARTKDSGKSYRLTDDFSDILADKLFRKESSATKYFECSIKGLFLIIDEILQGDVTNQEFKTKLWSTLEELIQDHQADHESDLKSTLLHSDLWSNNFLFLYDEQRPVKCKLIDYQTLGYGPHQSDVMQFILTNTRRDFRDQHLEILLTHYHKTLSQILCGAKVNISNILPLDEFLKSCDAFKLPAKVFAVIDRSITCSSDESYAEAIKSDDTFRKFIYDDRGKYIVASFNRDVEFRNLMIEDVLELRDMLFTHL